MQTFPKAGVVIIGCNEGPRLIRCLTSVLVHSPPKTPIVYVDAGSIDQSVKRAKELGIHAIELDATRPFTAARSYNAGAQFLQLCYPDLRYVQFIDSNCELLPHWMTAAIEILDHRSDVAVVSGTVYERHPDASIFNRLAQLEWHTPLGEVKECVGIAMIRQRILETFQGYNEHLIAGEEPEMQFRLRQAGWKIWRTRQDMAIHDAEMFQVKQWWQQSIRSGWAFEEGAAMHRLSDEGFRRQQSVSGWFWGLLMPLIICLLIVPTQGKSLLLLLGYGGLGWRIYHHRRLQGDRSRHARLYALWCIMAKLPQVIGQIQYWLNHLPIKQTLSVG